MESHTDAELAEMAAVPPPDFVSLENITRNKIGQFHSIMGTVVDCMPPRRTSKNEWQTTLRLTDPSLAGLGLQVVFFNDELSNVPTPQLGDILLVSKAKVNSFRGDMQLLSSKTLTDWISIPRSTIVPPSQRSKHSGLQGCNLPHRRSVAADPLTVHQQQWAITLASPASAPGLAPGSAVQDLADVQGPNAAHQTTPVASKRAANRKACLLKDVEIERFYDLTGQVIKVFSAGSSVHGDFLDIHLTDFTTHTNLHDYQPLSSHNQYDGTGFWRGPYGKQSLKIECYEPHASWFRKNAAAGQIITLQNVRIKMSRDITFIEGNLFPDRKYPNKICAFHPPPDDPVVIELLRRRKAYLVNAHKKGWNNLLPLAGDDAGAAEDETSSLIGDEPKRKKQKKAIKKQPAGSSLDPHDPTPSYREFSRRQRDPVLNPSVAISSEASETGLCKMGDIINNPTRFLKIDGTAHSLPFVNCKYLLQMRVVDFFPHDIHNFSVRKQVRTTAYGLNTRWLWAFYLIVEAAHESQDACKERLMVEVSGLEAKRFLGLEATNLKEPEGGKVYGALIRKLRLLWGDLDEVKQDYFVVENIRPSGYTELVYNQGLAVNGNRPFEGCVEEFGQKVESMTEDGSEDEADSIMPWQRHYKLFDTIIT